jgi:porphobilinogen synthase
MDFPEMRLRRLRQNEAMRRLVRETSLSVDDLIAPLFVRPGRKMRKPIPSTPGQFQLSVDEAAREAAALQKAGIPAIVLFGIPPKKDTMGSGAYAAGGIVQNAVRQIRKEVPNLLVITDVCLCEYTSHGHCGVVRKRGTGFELDNDATLKLLAKTAVSQARAGAHIVAPSAMMDGQVAAIRHALDAAGFENTAIMAYSAKFASSFYGPFRDAAESPPQFGDRSAYQMDPANAREALREVELDVCEGADIVMVKPALAYMDIIRQVRDEFDLPVACYNVSGEYAMVKAAAGSGWMDERRLVLEILTGLKRAGADMIITYHAKDVTGWLKRTRGQG